MKNPFADLEPALRVLCTEANVLPATGQAVVDMVNTDEEELYDRKVSGELISRQIWETSAHTLYRSIRPIPRSETHRLRYFIDGSAKTYFIGTLLEQNRTSPVQISQVGASMVHREDNGRMKTIRSELKILLTLDEAQVSEELREHLRKSLEGLQKFQLGERVIGQNSNAQSNDGETNDSRPRGAHRANWFMRQMELQLAKETDRDSNDWVVLDGSLGNEFETWKNGSLLGIAKSFSRENRFVIGNGPRAINHNLFTLLVDMKTENQRSAVFSRKDEGRILYWYVRIHPQKGLDYPLMGVVKVEMPNPDRSLIDSMLIDEISGWITAERNVTPYGRDDRWHAHLYSIYVAELITKAQFYSDEVLKAGIKWPINSSRS